MTGRNDDAIVAALEVVAQAMQNQPNAGVMDESRSLNEAQAWLKEMERIFQVMDCSTAQKVLYGTHMLAGEVNDWWVGTLQRLKAIGERGDVEFSKCIEFENGLHPKIKWAIGYQQIRMFTELVNMCLIYEGDSLAHSAYYKSLDEKGRKSHHDCKKPYDAPTDKWKQEVANGKKPSGGGAPATVRCYRCGEQGHRFNECENKTLRCYQCGKTDHRVLDCKDDGPTCFKYGE
ncbi:uncharacterized protein LOC131614612 [Vicia villosa]|uniref:uncharacterized protein LOC131614612 n=1 Tax=Vicia villosa TaxID=3911 RepID=UPI00273B3E9E|nr:uncharacterized protein LOC131614612 [Vicia villosa]